MEVIEAAELLTKDEARVVPALKEMAGTLVNRLLSLDEMVARTAPLPSVSTQRKFLRFQPRNAIGWTDLALSQLANGHDQNAEKSLAIALGLAPNNRHVLRSVASFYTHSGDPERANYHLNMSRATDDDPWLTAAEVSTAAAAGHTSRLAKRTREKVLSGDYDPRDVTELASAIATLELEHGNVPRSKKLFRLSMEQPTENAVAQTLWANTTQRLSLPVLDEKLDIPLAFEAAARVAYNEKRWADCTVALFALIKDQPFLLSPSVIGSYVACDLLSRPEEALVFTSLGLKTNPRDSMLHNNRAVAFARIGRLEEAKRALDDALSFSDKESVQQQITLRATRGLIAFRSGNYPGGDADYSSALEAASKAKLKPYIARVYVYWVREQVLADPPCASTALAWLKPLETYDDHGFKDIFTTIRSQIEVLAKATDPSGLVLASNLFAQKDLVGNYLVSQ